MKKTKVFLAQEHPAAENVFWVKNYVNIFPLPSAKGHSWKETPGQMEPCSGLSLHVAFIFQMSKHLIPHILAPSFPIAGSFWPLGQHCFHQAKGCISVRATGCLVGMWSEGSAGQLQCRSPCWLSCLAACVCLQQSCYQGQGFHLLHRVLH